MSKTLTIARAARRRRRLRTLLRTFGTGMLFASIATGVTVLIDRGFGLSLTWPVLAAPGTLTLLAMLAVAMTRREASAAATIELDQNLGLADRVTTGVAFSSGDRAGAFEQLALRDAERAASEVDLRRGVPVRATRVHRWWPVTTAAAVALAAWLPAFAPSADAPRAMTAQDQAEREAASERVSEAIEDATMALDDQPELFDEQTRRELESLERIQEELERQQSDPAEAEARAAEALAATADRLEEQAAAEERALDATAQRFSGATGEPDPLAEALAEGDFQAAAEELRALEQSLEGMDAAERERAAERLRNLAEQIDTGEGESAPSAEERLMQEGLDPASAQEIAQESNGDPDAAREALEQRGADPIEAQRVSEQMRQDQQQREAQREAQRNAQEFRESLDQAAGECQNPGGEGEQQQSPGGSSGFQRAQEAAERMDENSGSAAQKRNAAEDMRENANRLAQREEQRSGGGSGGTVGSGPSTPRFGSPQAPNDALRTDSVDARQGSDSTRVMGEVEAQGPAIPERRATNAEAQRALRDAAPSAERAIESQGVPARYRDLVRRYFRPSARPAPELAPAQDDPS